MPSSTQHTIYTFIAPWRSYINFKKLKLFLIVLYKSTKSILYEKHQTHLVNYF